MGLLVLAIAAPAAAQKHSLLAGHRAKLRLRGTPKSLAVFRSESALADFPDPRCPAVSNLHLAYAGDQRAVRQLNCALWRRTSSGYRYAEPMFGKKELVLIVAPARGRLIVRVSGDAVRRPGEPSAFEVELEVGEDSYCGRFDVVRAASDRKVVLDGPTRACELSRPNFLVVVLDDARFDGLDQMPVLQGQVVPDAVSFDNAFTPNAVCCPSRASILTGLYSLRHGTRHVAGPIGGADTFRESGADRETIAVWLRRAGYRTGLFGKYLNAYSTTESDKGPGGTFYIPPGWTDWWAFVSPEHYGGVYGQSYQTVGPDGTVTSYTDHTTDAEYSTDLSAQKLREFVAASVAAGKPFFAMWTPYAPHGETPGLLPAPASRHQGSFASLAPWRPVSWAEADASDKPHFMQYRHALYDGTLAGQLLQEVIDLVRIGQYETLMAVDEQIDAFLQQLAALGVDRDTLLIVTSDNGLAWGEHHIYGTKNCPYEECQRVPFIARYPRRMAPRSVAAPVLNLDIAPTLAALAGAGVPLVTDGTSFADLLASDEAVTAWRTDYLLEQWRVSGTASVEASAQVADGDRLRLFYGSPRDPARPAVIFEFDQAGGVSPGSIAVPIGATVGASMAALASAIASSLDDVTVTTGPTGKVSVFPANFPDETTIFLEEVDQNGVIAPATTIPNFFGVRDVANGFTWVEYETGERELYDLTADPFQLDNRANDPNYAADRLRLEQRLLELLSETEAR